MLNFPNKTLTPFEVKKVQLPTSQTYGPFSITSGTKKDKQYKKCGEWTRQENAKFIAFVEGNKQMMDSSEGWENHKKMSKFIETRNFRQCKMYHRKMIKQHGNIHSILQHLLKHFPNILQQIEKQKQRYIHLNEDQLKKYGEEVEDEKEKRLDPTGQSYVDDNFPKKSNLPQSHNSSFIPFPQNNSGFAEMQFYAHQSRPRRGTKEDWIECHRLFIEYLMKLNELRMRQYNM